METFSQLLNQYIQRIGISDAELSRTLGVSRQTIFRWREGLTTRPRRRDDLLTLAEKLRLTAAETDSLLLAAGFRPTLPPTPSPELPANGQPLPDPENRPLNLSNPPATSPAQVSSAEVELGPPDFMVVQAAGIEPDGATITAPAEAVETVVAASMTQAIDPSPPAQSLRGVLLTLTIILLGGIAFWLYQSPAHPPISATANPPSLTASTRLAINPTSPRQPFSFLIVPLAGQTEANIAAQVAAALQREAKGNRLTAVTISVWPEAVDTEAQAIHLWQRQNAAALILPTEQRIALYFRAAPTVLLPHLQAMHLPMKQAQAQQLRWLALLGLGQVALHHDESAVAHGLLAQAESLSLPDGVLDETAQAMLTVSLAIARFEQGVAMSDLVADLDSAALAYPQPAELFNLICRGYVLDNLPEQALPYCDKAIDLEPHPRFFDSRGLAHALLGQTTAAINDVQIYTDWLAQQSGDECQRTLQARQQWLDNLAQGQPILSPETVAQLRHHLYLHQPKQK